jgi:hypothetical protein
MLELENLNKKIKTKQYLSIKKWLCSTKKLLSNHAIVEAREKLKKFI